jgi:hypothetical protein
MTTHGIEKTVRIVVTSGLVNQSRFSKGLRESLEPRLKMVGPKLWQDDTLPLYFNSCIACMH